MNYCLGGGKLGSYSQIKSGEFACLVSLEGVGMEPPRIKVGTKADLEKGLLVDFTKH